jgi:peroxiredoxin Q/BCP
MIKIGQKAPDFRLQSQNGDIVSLQELLINKAVVLYFYPKDETMGCVMEACAFRDAYEDFSEMGAEVVGISADSVESHRAFALNRRLPFLLLSDTDLEVHKIYGADQGFLGLMRSRVTFLIDQKGIVRHVFSSQLAPRKHATESIQALAKLKELQS